eukprot:scaffold936_cov106-Amphora_coffeaeformis.AAC.16
MNDDDDECRELLVFVDALQKERLHGSHQTRPGKIPYPEVKGDPLWDHTLRYHITYIYFREFVAVPAGSVWVVTSSSYPLLVSRNRSVYILIPYSNQTGMTKARRYDRAKESYCR